MIEQLTGICYTETGGIKLSNWRKTKALIRLHVTRSLICDFDIHIARTGFLMTLPNYFDKHRLARPNRGEQWPRPSAYKISYDKEHAKRMPFRFLIEHL